MERTFKHLTKADRIRIEALIKAGVKIKEIADMLHVHRSTIYRELKRGRFTALNSDLTTEERYSPDIAHDKYEENLKSKGGSLKIGNDIRLANYIEEKIMKEDYSPAAVLGEIKAQQKESEFSVMICTTTLYSYIDKGIFLHLTNKNLPVKKNKKRTYKKVKKTQARASAGESIEKRPEEIETREEFGHWEMDTVKGKRGKSKNSLLVLTERKTRDEIVMKLPEHTLSTRWTRSKESGAICSNKYSKRSQWITEANLQTVKELNVQHWEQAAGQRHIIVIHTAATKEEATK